MSTTEALTSGSLIALTASLPQGAGHPQRDTPCFWELPPAPNLGAGALRCQSVGCVQRVWQRGSRPEEDAPCHFSQDAVTGLVDGDAFQGGAVEAGCCAAQASSWRVLNPWESPAGSNKHKHPNKPELKKLYLQPLLKEVSVLPATCFCSLSCWRGVVCGTQEVGGASSHQQ